MINYEKEFNKLSFTVAKQRAQLAEIKARLKRLEANDFVVAEEAAEIIPLPLWGEQVLKLCLKHGVRSKVVGTRRLYLRKDVERVALEVALEQQLRA